MGHVLVVDDDNLFLQVVCRALQMDGLTAIPARNGEEALAKIKNSRPMLICSIWSCLAWTGLTLLRTLRLEKETADIPVIIFSATTTESIVEKAITLGANAVLLKTRFSIAELREMVKEYVSQNARRSGVIDPTRGCIGTS